MTPSACRWRAASAVCGFFLLASIDAALAFQVREKTSRFDVLVVDNPTASLDVATLPVETLPSAELTRGGWDGFAATHGHGWSVYLDRRSGAPLLVEGRGIPWPVAADADAESVASSLIPFVATNRALLLADVAELVLDRDASGKLSPDLWQIVFGRAIAGVPVVGERYVFTIGHGNLISFGAPRWSRIDADPVPEISPKEALERLSGYMGLTDADGVKVLDRGTLQLIPMRAEGARTAAGGPYVGSLGSGYTSALVWRLVLRIDGETGTWEGLIDAHAGAIRSFRDINEYARAKGGVFPVSDDGICPDGCEQPGHPMPFADITIGAGAQTTTASGSFACTPGGATATTTLAGPYVKVIDTCGEIVQSVSCDADLDLAQSAGTDCAVPPGSTGGNTHASRTGFYHLNRIAQHGRTWLPSRPWLSAQLTDNVNLNQTCNAYWLPGPGTVNFFRSGSGCRNTGEIAGIFLHEWGHGLDSNDGGGFDNPSEAYADVVAFMSTHASCIGRGFTSFNCSGYGDACLDCTGIRDQDWAKHASNTPATPSGFLTTHCASGDGPCGKEVHCEGHVGAQTLWDLAARDLPASGLDPASAWQLADKLWYQSRLGSGGNAYNCALPSSDGCAVTSWFSKLRTIDDDDGNLANGTPHAAAIFAAFDRHQIACGAAGDASNQNHTICPPVGAPTLSAYGGPSAAPLSWTPVAGATSYNVLRNDAGCSAGSTIIANVNGTSFIDAELGNGFPQYYTVQAVGANASCDGPLSNCRGVIPHAFAGMVTFDAPSYSCAGTVSVSVTDGNIGAATTTVTVASAAEPAGETITLTRVSPGSTRYTGTIPTTSAAAAADGLISVANGGTITATYVDASDGQGGVSLARQTSATIDCVFPIITNVVASEITGQSARVTWSTNEAATSVVHYGLTPPPGETTAEAGGVVAHAVDLTGLAECSTYLYAVRSADAVGNSALDDAAGAYHTFATGKNTTVGFGSADTPVAIPDNNPFGATSTITVFDNKPVQRVTVRVNITHTFDADIALTLIPPAGAPIALSSNRGGFAANFVNTVFDDAAEAAISTGTAPFTGSFRPETPLAAAIGVDASGDWTLKVVDSAGLDVGTIDDWTLTLTYPAAACGPHATVQSHVSLGDSCATGGTGGGNGAWEAGEQVSFKLHLHNDGTTVLTGVTATVTPMIPGIVMIQGTGTFPSLPPGGSADSAAPHFAAYIPVSMACGSTASFQVAIASNQGSWSQTFGHGVGRIPTVTGTVLNESFAGGIPAAWTLVDGGIGGGAAATWTTANPGGRTIAAPMAAPVAIVDSDNAGNTGATQDEQLFTPAMNLSTATSATLEFDQFFRWFENGLSEFGDVDVRSSATDGAWVTVLRQQGAASANPDHKSIDVSAQAAGATGVQVRFHYYNAQFEWYWQVDNVRVDFVAPGACSNVVCSRPSGTIKPVADGSTGTPMRASRVGAAGSTINLTWDVATCASSDHHVLFGSLAAVASSTVSGSVCDLGSTGAATWPGVPAGSLWFVVVGDNDATVEGSWGKMTSGERGGGTASGLCGMAGRDNSGICP